MDMVLHHSFANFFRKYAIPALACSWIMGLIFGAWSGSIAFFDFGPLAATFHSDASFSLLAVMLFPIVVSALIIYMDQPWLLLIIAFLKAFSFAYVSWILVSEFGSAGWLIQFLIMFSDCISLPLLWYFWCGLLHRPRHSLISLSIPMVFAIVAVGILDNHFILPILSALQIS